MFGSFVGFALFSMQIIDRRRRRDMGEGVWRRNHMQMRAAPLHPPRAAVFHFGGAIDAIVALILLHPWLAGVGVVRRFLP